MIANTLDEVIEKLEEIIQTSIREESTMGYFAVLYQKVTRKVIEKIGQNYFENDQRMAQLDIVFANRYLQAYSDYRAGNKTTTSWASAFDSCRNNDFIVLQHLLLGMNAHINLDLGIAAVEVSKQEPIAGLESDFNKINDILSSMVIEVQADLIEIWPSLHWILKQLNKTDDFLIDFSMLLARNGAWKYATVLALELDEDLRVKLITERDVKIARVADKVTKHPFMIRMLFKIIRFGERGSCAEKIAALR